MSEAQQLPLFDSVPELRRFIEENGDLFLPPELSMLQPHSPTIDVPQLQHFDSVAPLRHFVEANGNHKCLPVDVTMRVLQTERYQDGWRYTCADAGLTRRDTINLRNHFATGTDDQITNRLLILYAFDPIGTFASFPFDTLIYVAAVGKLLLLGEFCFGTAEILDVFPL